MTSDRTIRCGSCSAPIQRSDARCPSCGNKIVWDAPKAADPTSPRNIIGTILLLGVVLVGVLTLVDRFRSEGEPTAAASSSTRQATSASRAAAWTPQRFSGQGTEDTRGFFVASDEWQACFTISRHARLSNGDPIGVLYVRVHRSTDGDTVGRLDGDASAGDLSGCTTVRSDPGQHYFSINAGTGVGWTIEAKP